MVEIKNYDSIILVTASRWDQDYSSASISLARELSKSVKVFFVDNPFTLKDILLGWRTPQIKRRRLAFFFGKNIYRLIEQENPNWIAVTPYAIIPMNWLPSGWSYNVLSLFNNWIFNFTLRRIVTDFKLKRFIYFNSYNPFFGYRLPRNFSSSLFIYQSRDNIKESEYVKKHGPELELKAAQNAQIRLATSIELVKNLSKQGYPFTYFPNAADVDLFSKSLAPLANLPDDLKYLRRPIIGYIGNICLRVDYDLLYKIVKKFNEATILLVGPRNDRSQHSIDFGQFKNIVFTGSKRLEELPIYLSVIDCAIIPFKINELTKSIYPLKINEYLAGGKPVVSTAFSTDIESFDRVIYISKDHEEFLTNIQSALSENDPELTEMRLAISAQNSWASRARQFWELVENFNS